LAVGEQSWLTVKKSAERDTALYETGLVSAGEHEAAEQ
jgi:hypothetical protein